MDALRRVRAALRAWLGTRRSLAAGTIVFLWAAIMMAVPQFNLLNYYFAFAMALVVPLAAGLVAAGTASASPPLPSAEAAATSVMLLLIPLVVVSFARIWISNCDPLGGLLHYALGPGIGVLFAVGLGLFLGTALPRPWPVLLLVLVFVALLVRNFAHFYMHPPISAFNHFAGHWSGAIYDDTVSISPRWGRFRMYSAALGLAFWAGAVALRRWPRAGLVLGPVAVAIVVVLFERRGPYDLTRDDIAAALGGRLETDHFVIIYPERGAVADHIEALALDHEFRWHQLKDALEVAPGQKITSYLYASETQKQRLIGAGATFIAKPWTREIHLNNIEVGQGVLRHELAHVFGAELNTGWLAIPTTLGFMPKMALVEGFAVALEGPRGRLTVHQWAAAMQREGIAPPMAKILGANGFLATQSGKAYTLAGSFLRWLRDTYGLSALHELYRSGDFEDATQKDADTLDEEWRTYLNDTVALTAEDLALARFHFDAPSRFYRVCALEIGALEAEADAAAHAGRRDEALSLRERILAFVPGDPERRFAVMDALISAGKLGEARTRGEALIADEAAGSVLVARARSRLADTAWLDGRPADAQTAWEALAAEPLDEATRRRVLVAAALAARGGTNDKALLDYLVTGAPGGTKALDWLAGLSAESAPTNPGDAQEPTAQDPILAYLLGRRAESLGERSVAEAALARAADGELPRPLRYEAERLRGHLAFEERRYAQAAERFATAATLAETQGQRDELQDWQDRMAFFDSHSSSGTSR